MPRFSIITTDYEHHVPRSQAERGLNSLVNQTFDDYELIIIHDGPKDIPYEEEFDLTRFNNVRVINTPVRMNNLGNSSRELGVLEAKGDFILHFNIDNFLYPECLETISNKIDTTNSEIVIFGIKHFKWDGGKNIFSGLPPIACNIDNLQLVASRQVWQLVGAKYNNGYISDSIIYEKMCKVYPWVHINKILAENY
jgi:glycosyltransferase involved in cell wall biosynthesis